MAYDRGNPICYDIEIILMLAKTNWILAESNRDRKRQSASFEFAEFLPIWLRPLSSKSANGNPEILWNKMRMLAVAMEN